MQNKDISNGSINWIEEAISKKHIKPYEYKDFSNFQEIGSGTFGTTYRVNWKNSKHYLVLKSFFNLDNTTVKEIVREVIANLVYDFFYYDYEANDLVFTIYSLNFGIELTFKRMLFAFMGLQL